MRPGGPLANRSDAALISPRENLTLRRAYCVGMGGSGMQAIAEWLVADGWQVSGSDPSATPAMIERFQTLSVPLSRQHDPDQIPPLLDMLVYSPAVPFENPERVAARERGIPEWSYPQALGRLMASRHGISIAGTHGKSTTTALVGHILSHAGMSPSIVCGARMLNSGRSGVRGSGELLVAESCEYRGHFLELAPRCIGLLGIEPDHFDCFPNFADAVATYREFIRRLPAEGVVIANRDCDATSSILSEARARKVSVSVTDDGADYQVTYIETTPIGMSLTIRLHCGTLLDFTTSLSGNHHAINIAAAVAIACEHGVSITECQTAVASFAGIGRRFEHRGDWEGVTWIDDYAHHPTAVRALLLAARDRYPDRRIWCLFQPHQISRTRMLASDFSQALAYADRVLVQPVFGAREADESERMRLSQQLVQGTTSLGVESHFVADLDHTWDTLETHLRPGDVVLTVGAGDIDRIYHEFTGRLRRHHAS